MTKTWALLTTVILLFSPPLTPVFDCSKTEVRRDYPKHCPALPDPLLTGGGRGGGAESCRGLCGVVDGVLDKVGLGGLL